MANKNLPELTLRGLRTFIVVEETGSISDGARRIGSSSSGVSQQITALEQSVGARLFDRQSRPLKLTPAGKLLHAHARKILEATDNAQAELSRHDLVDLPKLTLAIIDDLDTSLTPVLVAILQRRFRNCFINVYSGRSDHVIEMLQQREADISVSASVPDDVNDFRTIPILREPFILVTAKGLLNNDSDICAQLSDAPFIQYSEDIPIGKSIAQHLKRVRFDVTHKYALEASRSVIALVGQAKGWTITTPLNLLDAERFISQVDVSQIPFPAFSRTICLIARRAEFGDLPDRLAEDCRNLIGTQVAPRFDEIVPQMAGIIKIADS